MDVNSTSLYVSFYRCFQSAHVGMIVGIVATSLRLFLGMPAHFWLLWLPFHNGRKIKPTQVFALNMILLELIFCVTCMLEVLTTLIINNGTLKNLSAYLFGLGCVGRSLFLICISIEQYLAVIHPIIFLRYKSLQYRIVFAAAFWLMTAAFSVYQIFLESWANHIFNSVFFISVIIISFCCVSVLRALKHPGPGDTQISMERGRDVGNQQKRNAFKTIFAGLLTILITYFPQISLSFINAAQIGEELFLCNITPSLNSVTVFGVMITPLMQIYKNCHWKCFTHQSKISPVQTAV